MWEAISWVPDTQCAWQILLQCAGPRCHYFLRTIPPSQSETYADAHDEGMWRALEAVMGRLPGDDRQTEMARNISSLPMRMGGLGLRSARRSAPAAYWASWADCLSMLQKRLPEVTTHIMDQLAVGAGGQGCLGELCSASRRLDQSGFVARPDWTQLQEGLRPPQPVSSELGEWQHGWQYHASSPLEHHFRETVIFAQSDAADRAHLTSPPARCFLEHRLLWSSKWNLISSAHWCSSVSVSP